MFILIAACARRTEATGCPLSVRDLETAGKDYWAQPLGKAATVVLSPLEANLPFTPIISGWSFRTLSSDHKLGSPIRIVTSASAVPRPDRRIAFIYQQAGERFVLSERLAPYGEDVLRKYPDRCSDASGNVDQRLITLKHGAPALITTGDDIIRLVWLERQTRGSRMSGPDEAIEIRVEAPSDAFSLTELTDIATDVITSISVGVA